MPNRVRYEIVGTLRLETPLHIGSGRGSLETDAAIVRDLNDQPYVPGSSLRGVLRSAVEAYVGDALSCHGLSIHPGECDHLNKPSPRQENRGEPAVGTNQEAAAVQRPRTLRDDLVDLIARGNEPEIVDWLKDKLCATCRLFGTVHWASPLQIPDLPLIGRPVNEADPKLIRQGVGIDRDTGAAREQIKYDFEVLPAIHQFRFTLFCTRPADLPDEDWQRWRSMLALGLRLLEMGALPLGGRAARGVGRVKLDLEAIAELPLSGRGLLNLLIKAPPAGISRPADLREVLPAHQLWEGSARAGEWIDQQLKALPESAVA